MKNDDLTPLPRHVQWWRRTRDRRQSALTSFKSAASALAILAITASGAILISFGVYRMFEPAGFIVGGLMCWVLLWSHEQDKRRRQ